MSDVLEAPPVIETGTALETIEATNLTAVFTTPGGIEAILTRIEADARARAAKLDISTPKGRAAIASLAKTKIAGAKVQIVKAGKKLSEDARATVKSVNADCNVVEARMDALRDEVRKPLDDYEAAEAAKESAHKAAIAEITALATVDGLTSDEITARIWQVPAPDDRDWSVFAAPASKAIEATLEALRAACIIAVEREAAAAKAEVDRLAEIARIDAENEAKRIAREQEIAANAAAVATMEAEAKAERERVATAAAAERKAEADRQETERQARVLREAAAKAQQDAKDALAREEAARVMAEARERQAKIDQAAALARVEKNRAMDAEKAKRDRDAAVEAERVRVAGIEAAKQADDARRAKNVAHRARVDRDAVMCLLTLPGCGLTEAQAKQIVAAIANDQISGLVIEY